MFLSLNLMIELYQLFIGLQACMQCTSRILNRFVRDRDSLYQCLIVVCSVCILNSFIANIIWSLNELIIE
ncbi:hypothetical protein NEOLEDRAFT_735747 [Neolentinus lepideus HHB14362 ss-1]|uniref:Uncharacterized protein n=1 Tax=Neolentinus lepideus HHB14362 ss-1 TaxID=1314782 RepID=A0A165PYS2_9AGAM|nr:hypothetical protein NEOLEDRAFT_735747 [Neolentinus lepideus HHB14362 ss-1]